MPSPQPLKPLVGGRGPYRMGHHIGGIGVGHGAAVSGRDDGLDIVEGDAREDVCVVVC